MQSQKGFLTKVFTNPSERKPVRQDFPKVSSSGEELLQTIKNELQKRGTSAKDVTRINILYPQKHPEIDPHSNGRMAAQNLKNDLMEENAQKPGDLSHIIWTPADCLYEQHHLNRSDPGTNSLRNGFLSCLLKRQRYTVDPALQKTPPPFLTAGNDNNAPEYFILTDHMFDRGRTFANMINFIEHNGGIVLAAHSFNIMREANLPQKSTDHNTGQIPDLATHFSDSTYRKFSPDVCAILVNEALAPHGLSLAALTNEECKDLKILSRINSFENILREIGNAPVDPV